MTSEITHTADEHLHIFINHMRFSDGIKHKMTIDEIAHLVGLAADNAIVRREHDGSVGPPLEGTIEIHNGERFTVQPLHIFVNRRRFDKDIKRKMTADEIARLVGLTADTATVRREHEGQAGPPLEGVVEIHDGEHFLVTRKHVQGGHYGR